MLCELYCRQTAFGGIKMMDFQESEPNSLFYSMVMEVNSLRGGDSMLCTAFRMLLQPEECAPNVTNFSLHSVIFLFKENVFKTRKLN